MNDIFSSLYAHYASEQGAGTVHALTGGRMFRAEAPAGAQRPCLACRWLGGEVTRFFGGSCLERCRIEFVVAADRQGDQKPAGQIQSALDSRFDGAVLPLAQSECLAIQRNGLPVERVQDGVTTITSSWVVERQRL